MRGAGRATTARRQVAGRQGQIIQVFNQPDLGIDLDMAVGAVGQTVQVLDTGAAVVGADQVEKSKFSFALDHVIDRHGGHGFFGQEGRMGAARGHHNLGIDFGFDASGQFRRGSELVGIDA